MGWIIFLRVVLSVSASAVQKRLLLNRVGVYQSWILTYALMLAPACIIAFSDLVDAPARFWVDIAIGGGLDALGNLAMIAALRATDLSIFGPLNALRPILALLFGWLFLAETPTGFGVAGVGITVAGGILLFAERPSSRVPWSELARILFLRVSGLALGVAGSVFLKRAALRSTAEATVAAWTICGLLVLLAVAAGHRRGKAANPVATARKNFRWLLLHALVFGTMIWLTIRIFQETLLAYAFVYFQLGMVLQVFAGRIFFQERAFTRRLIASAIMAGGSVLVLWKG